jgi:hypothetical protein
MSYVIEQFCLRMEQRFNKYLKDTLQNDLKRPTIIERCGGANGDIKVYGFLTDANGMPELKWYAINGLGELYEYDGVIVQCQ